jgi:transposase
MLRLDGKLVFLACGQTDMRKQINGLAAIVEGSFKLDPFDGALFVFCNRKRDRLKVLEFDVDGFWLKYLFVNPFNDFASSNIKPYSYIISRDNG